MEDMPLDQTTEEEDLLRTSVERPKEGTTWSKRSGVDIIRGSSSKDQLYCGDGEDESDIAEFLNIAENWHGSEVDDDPVELEVMDCIDLWRQWRRAVIIKVLGRNVSFRVLQERLHNMWCSKGKLDIVDLELGFYVVRFCCKEDYDTALEKGPWVIQGHYLTVRKWRPFFVPSQEKIDTTMVWIRFPQIPLELFDDHEFILRLAKRVGKPIKVDIVTSDSTRGRFARVCVEMNLHKVLRTKVVLKGFQFKVEYESLQMSCFECGRYGHKTENCPSIQHANVAENDRPSHDFLNPQTPQGPTPEKPFGPWMLAPTRRRKATQQQRGNNDRRQNTVATNKEQQNEGCMQTNRSPRQASQTEHGRTGSRFNVLIDENADTEMGEEEVEDMEDPVEAFKQKVAAQHEALLPPKISLISKEGPLGPKGNAGKKESKNQSDQMKRKGQASGVKDIGMASKRAPSSTGISRTNNFQPNPLHDISNNQEQLLIPNNPPGFLATEEQGNGHLRKVPDSVHFKSKPPDGHRLQSINVSRTNDNGLGTVDWKLRDQPTDEMDLGDGGGNLKHT